MNQDEETTGCINLMERYGQFYRITYDLAYDPKGRPRDTLDSWMMLIPCERDATIGPHGDDELRVEIEGNRPKTRDRVIAAGGRLDRDGDDGCTLIFNVRDFDAVAEIIKPRRKRQLTIEQCQKLISVGKQFTKRQAT